MNGCVDALLVMTISHDGGTLMRAKQESRLDGRLSRFDKPVRSAQRE
jgi:hypothetical protein